MGIATNIKDALNTTLRSVNIKIDSLTAQDVEAARIKRQMAIGQFDAPAFPLLDGMASFDESRLAATYVACRAELDRLMQGTPPARFDRTNSFYSSPDAEVLYLMVRSLVPKRIIE